MLHWDWGSVNKFCWCSNRTSVFLYYYNSVHTCHFFGILYISKKTLLSYQETVKFFLLSSFSNSHVWMSRHYLQLAILVMCAAITCCQTVYKMSDKQMETTLNLRCCVATQLCKFLWKTCNPWLKETIILK